VRMISTMDGVAGTVVPAFVFSMSRTSENTHHTLDRQFSALESGLCTILQGIKQPTLRVLSSATRDY
jgi:hypothetical protein